MPSPADIITADKSLAGCLPKGFLLGAASASHQIEGCIEAGGKGEGLWDRILAHQKGDNGEDACNSYEQWQEDVDLAEAYGFNCYRFSISWPRIIPNGGREDPINEEGVQYYSNLIDALLKKNITPVITIFHWDHPQALEERYGGFFNEKEIVADFVRYSDVLFERLGDRCKHWVTFNEPHIFTMRASMVWAKDTWDVNEDYCKFARTITLAHARCVELYRNKYQAKQNGTIGVTLNADWAEPLDDSPEAKAAADRTMEMVLGLYADPIFAGEFSDGLKEEYGDRLPKFSAEEMRIVKDSSDLQTNEKGRLTLSFGLNHYCASWTTGKRISVEEAGPPGWVWSFGRTEKVHEKDGKIIGTPGLGGHLCNVPWGFRKCLVYIHEHYTKNTSIPIWITENGFPVDGEADMPLAQAIDDTPRQEYYAGYIHAMLQAMREDGVNVGGYMAWSLLDNLEWERGYKPRFGLTVVDKKDGFKRYPKKSSAMLRDIYAYLQSQ